MVCARDSVRGSVSRLTAVTPALGQRLRVLRVDERLEQADDDLAGVELADLLGRGLLHAQHDICLAEEDVLADDARAGRSKSASGKAAPCPAPAWTRTSWPAAVSLPMASGTSATRCSFGALSLTMATFIEAP